MTSNLGSDLIAAQESGQDLEEIRPMVMEVVRASFRPEFLNRLDETILFRRLAREHMDGIVEIQLDRLRGRVRDRGIAIKLDGAARAWLADQGYDPVYGARPLKRTIQRALENPLAQAILEGRVNDGDEIKVSAGKDGLLINGERAEAA